MLIQIFSPISMPEINAWLAENPRIEIKGFSVAAGADSPAVGQALSICAILYEPPAAPAGVSAAAASGVEELIEEVAIRVAPPAPSVAPRVDVGDEGTTRGPVL